MSGKRKTNARGSRAPERAARVAPARTEPPTPPAPRKASTATPRKGSAPSSRRGKGTRLAIAAVLSFLVIAGVLFGMRGRFSGGSTANLEKKSIEELERLALRSPMDAKVLSQYGTALLKEGAANDAAGIFQRVVQLEPANVNAQLGLGYSLNQVGDLGGAEAAYKKAVELEPRNYPAHYQLMRLYHENGELQSALKAIQAALEVRPTEVSGWYARGHLHGLLREEAAAARAFEKVVVLAPNHAPGWRALGRVYWHMDRLDEAEGALKRALALKPNDPHTLWWLGQVYLKLPDNPQNRFRASEVLQQATAANQRPLPEAHVELARLYIRNDQPLLAEQSLRKALQSKPDLEAAHFELGRLLTRMGRKSEGESHLARYEATNARRRKIETLEGKARTNPPDTASLLELARLYREFGNVPAAMRAYRRYLLARPEDGKVVAEMTDFRREVMPQPAESTVSDASAPHPFSENDHSGHGH